MKALFEMDKALEYVGNNVRGGLEDFLRIKQMTAKKIITLIMLPVDIYDEEGFHRVILGVLYVTGLVFSAYDSRQINNAQGTKILKNNDSDIRVRLMVLFMCVFMSYVDNEPYMLGIHLYLIRTFHDTDDRGIRNWIKAKLKTLKKALKKPEKEAVPI